MSFKGGALGSARLSVRSPVSPCLRAPILLLRVPITNRESRQQQPSRSTEFRCKLPFLVLPLLLCTRIRIMLLSIWSLQIGLTHCTKENGVTCNRSEVDGLSNVASSFLIMDCISSALPAGICVIPAGMHASQVWGTPFLTPGVQSLRVLCRRGT